MSRVPPLLSKRARAEGLHATLLNLMVRLDQLDRQQSVEQRADEDPCGRHRQPVDGEAGAAYTFAEMRAELTEQIDRACEREPDLLPLLPGVAAANEGREERYARLTELRERKEIAQLEAEIKRIEAGEDVPARADDTPNRAARRAARRR